MNPHKGKGSSKHPCSLFYGGEKPFSQIESRVLGVVLKRNSRYIKMYIGIHGYEGSVLYPWCYKRKPCNDHKKLVSILTFIVYLLAS